MLSDLSIFTEKRRKAPGFSHGDISRRLTEGKKQLEFHLV